MTTVSRLAIPISKCWLSKTGTYTVQVTSFSNHEQGFIPPPDRRGGVIPWPRAPAGQIGHPRSGLPWTVVPSFDRLDPETFSQSPSSAASTQDPSGGPMSEEKTIYRPSQEIIDSAHVPDYEALRIGSRRRPSGLLGGPGPGASGLVRNPGRRSWTTPMLPSSNGSPVERPTWS